MSNIYLKIFIDENWRSQNFDFLSLEKLAPGQFGASAHVNIINFQTSCWNLKIRGLAAKFCVAFLIFWFWKELWRFKGKECLHLVKQKYKR